MFTCRSCVVPSLKRLVVDPFCVIRGCFGAMPFKLQGEPPAKKPFKPKRIADVDLDFGPSAWSWLTGAVVKSPPTALRNEFDWTCNLWACFDIETHDLAPGRHERGWEDGDFGHLRLKTDYGEVRALRAVQIGWTVGKVDSSEPPVTKSRLVKPKGFAVTNAAAKIHKIKHDDAAERGGDLGVVVAEFMHDVFEVADAGGRICAHQIEFDAAIIAAELVRTDFSMGDRVRWADLVSCGLCTMNPHITKWCCEHYRRSIDTYGNNSVNPLSPCSLEAVARTLLQPCQELQDKAHDAGSDSRLGWLIVAEYRRRVRDSGENAA